jgi:hypothetical protein
MKLKHRIRTCVFCGLQKSCDRHHVPAKSLFSRPLPNDLKTVDACQECHASLKKDEDWFRFAIAARWDAGKHSVAQEVVDAAVRGLADEKRRGLRKRVVSSIEEVDVVTPAGLYLGRAARFKPDIKRLHRVVSFTVRGLLYLFNGSRVASDYTIQVAHLEPLFDGDDDSVKAAVGLAEEVMKSEKHTIGGTVFNYWCVISEENHIESAWVLQYYACVRWLVVVKKDGQAQ